MSAMRPGEGDAPPPLAGQVVAVTGASSGIGRAAAARFLDEGATVAVLARRGPLLQELVAGWGDRAWALAGDVTRPADVQAFADGILQRFGRIDVLVVNAGLNIRERRLTELTAASWERLLAANLTSAFHCTQAVLPAMRRQRGGLIIYVSSVSALGADASGAAYQAAKRGVAGLAGAVRHEEAEHGIRTSVVFPGTVNTPLVLNRPQPPTPAQLAAALQPEDVASACSFIAGLPPRVAVPELVLRPAWL